MAVPRRRRRGGRARGMGAGDALLREQRAELIRRELLGPAAQRSRIQRRLAERDDPGRDLAARERPARSRVALLEDEFALLRGYGALVQRQLQRLDLALHPRAHRHCALAEKLRAARELG